MWKIIEPIKSFLLFYLEISWRILGYAHKFSLLRTWRWKKKYSGEETVTFFGISFYMATFGKFNYVLVRESKSSKLSELVSDQTVSSHLSWQRFLGLELELVLTNLYLDNIQNLKTFEKAMAAKINWPSVILWFTLSLLSINSSFKSSCLLWLPSNSSITQNCHNLHGKTHIV